MAYVIVETTTNSAEAKAFLETKFGNYVGLNRTVDISNQLENLNMQVCVLGGGSEHLELMKVKKPEEIVELLLKYSKFTRNNPGFPLAYSSTFVKDNSRAMVQAFAQYTETTRTVQNHGWLELRNTAGFIVVWNIFWEEVGFDDDGNEYVTRRGWEDNDRWKFAPWRRDLQFAGNVRNIEVKAEAISFLYRRTLMDRKNIPLIDRRNISIWGLLYNEQVQMTPEQAFFEGGPTFNTTSPFMPGTLFKPTLW